MQHSIDFILTYLDPNDVEWQKQKNEFMPGHTADVNPNRYREWDNLKYFFRGVERFAPWVRKVHIVTCGHLPKWLNTEHPKLSVIKHSDYIPKKWLPTFSSRCIDMNFQRIPQLAEHFVYFNDDMFLTNRVRPEDFFVNGLPCDTVLLRPDLYTLREGIALHIAPIVNTAVINRHFNIRQTLKEKPGNWVNLKYGKPLLHSMMMMTYGKFSGFEPMHLPYSYLKTTYRTVWEEEGEICEEACSHRFREPYDVNHWLFNYWQFATNNFYPRRLSDGHCYQLHGYDDAIDASEAVKKHKYKMVCLNDTLENNDDFERICKRVNESLASILPKKSKFEL